MKTKNTDSVSSAVEYPIALLGAGVKLAKGYLKANKSWAELASLCIVEAVDWKGLIKFAFVQAGGIERDSRGAITNASKFIAASLAVRQGLMDAREFAALKTDAASAAFKQAGGMDGDGLNPEAWLEAYRFPAPKAETGKKDETSGERKPLSSDAFILALILQKRNEMTVEGRKAAASALIEGLTKSDL